MSAHRHPRQHNPRLQLAVTVFGAIVIFFTTLGAVITVRLYVTQPAGEFERELALGILGLLAIAAVISVYIHLQHRAARAEFDRLDAGWDTGTPEEHTRPWRQASPSENRIFQHLRGLGHILQPKGLSEGRAAKLAERLRRATLIRRAGEAQPAPALAPLPPEPVAAPRPPHALWALPAPIPVTEAPPVAISDDLAEEKPLYEPWDWPETGEFPAISEPVLEGGAA